MKSEQCMEDPLIFLHNMHICCAVIAHVCIAFLYQGSLSPSYILNVCDM